ncbi:hypothetical protein [Telluribacter sp. SYSU D00476]|uniref:hypothetical protein n=1 Tax=Telluribacter sp. SYSU D00476 TaxID=2811430 RepID=UPI001FF3926C|nr:hypothetical protein [Telluribacter sp. SYSU D00476]
MEKQTYVQNEQNPAAAHRSTKLWQVLNLVGFAGMVVMNYLANAVPINGQTTGELSDKYPNLFVPADVTFSIWGVIYLALGAYTVYQALPLVGKQREDVTLSVNSMNGWYFFTSLLNASWIVAWHYELFPVSLAIMLMLLVSLLRINFGLFNIQPYLSATGRFLTKAAFGLYLGWICIATIANITAWLVAINWQGSGLGPETWAFIVILLGMLIGLYTAVALSNGYISLAVAWALVGIYLKRSASAEDTRSLMILAGIGAVLLTVYSVYALFIAPKESNKLRHTAH